MSEAISAWWFALWFVIVWINATYAAVWIYRKMPLRILFNLSVAGYGLHFLLSY